MLGNGNAFAMDIAIVSDDVTEMDADAQFQTLRFGASGVVMHRSLDRDRAGDRVENACEFRKRAVSRLLDYPSAMGRDQRQNEGITAPFDRPVRARFIQSHQPAIADDVRVHDRCQPPHAVRLPAMS